jgi:hypothetical protein
MHRPRTALNVIEACPEKEPNKTTTTAIFGTVESTFRLASWFHLFAYKQFHVLLNSLFKVLCNFPSRYLFAIGLAVIFSFRWSLPPTLGCTFKQPDSIMTQYACISLVTAMGLAPSMEKVLVRGTCDTKAKHDALRQSRCISRSPYDDGT